MSNVKFVRTTTVPSPGSEVADGPFKGLFFLDKNPTYIRLVKKKGDVDVVVWIDPKRLPGFTQNYVARSPEFKVGERVQTGTGIQATIRGLDDDQVWIEYDTTAIGYGTSKRSDLYPIDKDDCKC